jgi:hypothetical protein
VAQLSRGRVSVPAQAALSGSPKKASGFAGGPYLASRWLLCFRATQSFLGKTRELQNSVGTCPDLSLFAQGTGTGEFGPKASASARRGEGSLDKISSSFSRLYSKQCGASSNARSIPCWLEGAPSSDDAPARSDRVSEYSEQNC